MASEAGKNEKIFSLWNEIGIYMRLTDIITAAGFLVFSGLYYFVLIPVWVVSNLPEGQLDQAALRPDLLPRITIVLFALTTIFLGIGALRQPPVPSPDKGDRSKYWNVSVVFIAMYLYVIGLKFFGFLLITPLFLGGMVTFMGVRDWRYSVSLALIFPLALHYFFWLSFQVILPEGNLF
jgi:hypothetical protein